MYASHVISLKFTGKSPQILQGKGRTSYNQKYLQWPHLRFFLCIKLVDIDLILKNATPHFTNYNHVPTKLPNKSPPTFKQIQLPRPGNDPGSAGLPGQRLITSSTKLSYVSIVYMLSRISHTM